MAILPPAVLTTVQIVGGLAASAKNALDVAKASSDHMLKAAISELYDSVLDVKGRVLDLDEENRRLKVEMVERGNYVGPVAPHGYYFQADRPEDPRFMVIDIKTIIRLVDAGVTRLDESMSVGLGPWHSVR
jgi:hypothetical protein